MPDSDSVREKQAGICNDGEISVHFLRKRLIRSVLLDTFERLGIHAFQPFGTIVSGLPAQRVANRFISGIAGPNYTCEPWDVAKH